MINLKIGDIITTRKMHPCGSSSWEIIRVGADYKIKCLGCGRLIMLSSDELLKRIKTNERGNKTK